MGVITACEYCLPAGDSWARHVQRLTYAYSCENIVLWRGHFNATGSETAANLTIYGGECKSSLSIRGYGPC